MVRTVTPVAVRAFGGVVSTDGVATRLTGFRMGIADRILADRTERSVVGASVAAAHMARLDVVGRVIAITVRAVAGVVRTKITPDIDCWDAVGGAKPAVTNRTLS